jgi:hypothetical protein
MSRLHDSFTNDFAYTFGGIVASGGQRFTAILSQGFEASVQHGADSAHDLSLRPTWRRREGCERQLPAWSRSDAGLRRHVRTEGNRGRARRPRCRADRRWPVIRLDSQASPAARSGAALSGGAIAGAGLGAQIGSVPGVGTIAGGIVGAVAGLVIGAIGAYAGAAHSSGRATTSTASPISIDANGQAAFHCSTVEEPHTDTRRRSLQHSRRKASMTRTATATRGR